MDLLKGIAVGTGMANLTVEGATGGLHTDYEGKARAALNALLKDSFDFAYIHDGSGRNGMGIRAALRKKSRLLSIWMRELSVW